MSHCRTCKARIIWAISRSHAPMPLNPEPVAGGNIELVAGVANVVSSNPDVRRYVSHFATCAQADEHRKART